MPAANRFPHLPSAQRARQGRTALVRQCAGEPAVRLSLMRLCHRTRGLGWLGKKIPPAWFYRRAQLNMSLLVRFSGRWTTEATTIGRAMSGHPAENDPAAIGRRNLVYKRWLRNLVDAWPSWGARLEDWCFLEGEEHLIDALSQGRGVVL